MKVEDMRVEPLGFMGSDLTVVNAARVSFDKESDWNEDYRLCEKDVRLIKYLARHGHWSPFAHTCLQFRITAPIFVARQLAKHQVGGVWNEASRRYVDAEPTFYFPDEWRSRPQESVKQGSGAPLPDSDAWDSEARGCVEQCLSWYRAAIAAGMAPEQARMVLPQNMMTTWYWTGSLMFFARVTKQRTDPHAQAETRFIASEISRHAREGFPVSWTELVGDAHE